MALAGSDVDDGSDASVDAGGVGVGQVTPALGSGVDLSNGVGWRCVAT